MHKTARKILEYIESHPKCTFDDVEKHIGEIYEESVYFQQVNKNGYLRNSNHEGLYILENAQKPLLVLSDKGKIALDEYRELRLKNWLYIAGSLAAIITAILKALDYCNR